MTLATGARLDQGDHRGGTTTIFVADSTSEAETVSRALRTAGYTVIDVPPSMLVARIAVQHPRVILVDADTEGVLDVIERMRELPYADDIHVLFIARPGGAISSPEEALALEGSGLFVRPVDVSALVQKVAMLTSAGVSDGKRASIPSAAPSVPVLQKATSSPPSLPPVSMRASNAPGVSETKSSAPPSPRPSKLPSEPPGPLAGGSSRRVMSLAPPVSDELQHLLAEADHRVEVQVAHESIVPSPEDEIEAVLPADLLAALDEPIEEEDDDDDPVVPPRATASPVGGRERTSIRGGSRVTRTSTTGGGQTTGAAARGNVAARSAENSATPAPPHTHGGTHAGPTGEGLSTTGGEARSDSIPRTPEGTLPPPSAWVPLPLTTAAHMRESAAPRSVESPFPSVLGPGDAMRVVAHAIAARTTGSLCLIATEDAAPSASQLVAPNQIERRIVLREGDVVTTSSTAEDESLLAFLGVRGDLPRETVRRLASKFPAFGRHAGAALVARGYVRQDQMWPTLRAHAEWLFARALQTASGRLIVEPQAPGRLGGEPGVFGGSTGAAVFVEVVRRVVSPAEALERLGGIMSRIGMGPETRLLEECALDAVETEQVRSAPGRPVRDVLDRAPEGDLATVLFALTQLGVLEVLRATGTDAAMADDSSAPDLAALDAEGVRQRIGARLQLVEDGDYFALLGVPRNATGYEVRRAFLELRRAFEPSRVLTPEVSDLADDVRKIASVLEEAYDILKDAARRERYRRAIDAVPEQYSAGTW